MDSARFDGLIRRFGQSRSRRQALRGIGAAALGVVGFARAGTGRVASAIIICPECQTPDSAGTGCVPDPNQEGISCDDGDPCTHTDTCPSLSSDQAGVCTGISVVCTPLDQCHDAGVCNSNSGCPAPTLTVGSCKNGHVKGGPCDCDGSCCGVGRDCVGQAGKRRCVDGNVQ
jgi:hypothetical protein